MKKKYKKGLSLIIILVIVVFVLLLMFKVMNSLKKKTEIKVIDVVDNFEYKLEDRDTVLYKNLHQELKKNLENKEIDYDAYAKSVAQIFIVDLYTLDNKVSSYDVGGIDFIYPDALANYKLNVETTLYKVLENKASGKGKNYPTVKEIEVTNLEKSTFKIGEDTFDSYVISLNWNYEKDYGYDTKGIVTLIRKDEKLYIVEYKVEE